MDEHINCDFITFKLTHQNLVKLVHFELLEKINYRDRDYYFLPNALLRKKKQIFKSNGFFSIMENKNFTNFVITKKFAHCDSICSLADLMHGVHNEITCGKINLEYDKIDIFKWDDVKTIHIIGSFLQYEFNEYTFKDFVITLFPEETDCIMLYFELLDNPNFGNCITYKIKIYKDSRQIYVDISTGFYGL